MELKSSKKICINFSELIDPLKLDPKVQIHRMVIKAFATFKELQQVCEEQNLPNGQPLEDTTNDIHTPLP